MVIARFEPTGLCRKCHGQCCIYNPGPAIPKDFGNDPERVALALASGKWVIDHVHNLFVRPESKPDIMQMLGAMPGRGRCIFHRTSGCVLTERPAFCRSLEPNDAECVQHGSYRDLRDAWEPWQPILKEFMRSSTDL